MNSSVRLIPSGFGLIDQNWGGIYKGGSYIIVGPRKSGRTLLGLQFALQAAKSSEVCLYFTNMRPKDLMIQASSINFDIQSYMNQNLIIVVRVAPPNDVYEFNNPDKYLIEYLNDIITVIDQYNPNRIIFDELTQYIGFQDIGLLKKVFVNTLEIIEDRNITSLFIVGEPATQKTQEIIDTLTEEVTGVIYIRKSPQKIEGKYHGGTVTIIPNVGHTEGQFDSEYRIEPFKGVTVYTKPPKFEYEKQPQEKKPKKVKKKTDTGFFAVNNLYNLNDFMLILNNQIALYNSTGQIFQVIFLRIDPAAQTRELLSVKQLLNIVRSITSKKDKICEYENKILILQVKSDGKSLLEFMNKIIENLPSSDESYVELIKQYISIYSREVDEGIDKAEDMIGDITISEKSSDLNFVPISKYT